MATGNENNCSCFLGSEVFSKEGLSKIKQIYFNDLQGKYRILTTLRKRNGVRQNKSRTSLSMGRCKQLQVHMVSRQLMSSFDLIVIEKIQLTKQKICNLYTVAEKALSNDLDLDNLVGIISYLSDASEV